MRILAVHSGIFPDPNKQSQVDHWRIMRPMRELEKHVKWNIEHSPIFIPSWKVHKDKAQFTEQEINAAGENLKHYDIIFSSYHPDPTAFTLMLALNRRYGTQFVMDCDDDMFAINPDNPFWNKMEHEHVYWMQRMIANNMWITTPSEVLAERFAARRPDQPADSVIVIPNYINDDFAHPPFDNGDEVIIGYCGGSSHYFDLHDSGVLPAIAKLMHENKNIRFKLIGMFSDVYTPKGRTHFNPGVRGTRFLKELYPTMNFDIAIAPLNDNIFNWGKSNIKWQEATRAGSVFVASNIGPYTSLKDGQNALLVKQNNEEGWYKALKKVVDNKKLRKTLVSNAQADVMLNWKLENKENWGKYKDLFERVVKNKEPHANANHRTVEGLFAGQAK